MKKKQNEFNDFGDMETEILKLSYSYKNEDMANNSFTDTFFMPNLDLVCIIGPKTTNGTPIRNLIEYLKSNKIKFEEINITHDFVFWMLWKVYADSELSPGFTIDSFEDLEVASTPQLGIMPISSENVPKMIKTKDSAQQMPSFPICYGLFNEKSLNHLRAEFEFNDNTFIILIDIFYNIITNRNTGEQKKTEKSIIHILAQECLEDIQYSKKLDLSLPLIYILSELIIKWNDSPVDYKYPDEKYIDALSEKMNTDFNETKENFKKFKKKYCQKISKECENKVWLKN